MKIKPWRFIGLAIMAYIAYQLDWDRLGDLLKRTHWSLLGAAVALNLPVLWLKSLRWRWLVRMQGVNLSMKDAFLYYLASLYIGFITPGRLGEFTKLAYLKTDHGMGAGLALSNVLADRACDLYLVLALAMAGAGWSGLWPAAREPARWGLLLLLIAPLAFIMLDKFRPLPEALGRLATKRKSLAFISGGMDDFTAGIRSLMKLNIWPAGFLTLTGYGLFFFQCSLLAWSVGLPLTYFDIAPIMSITNLASYIPVSISGLGTREAALCMMLGSPAIELETIMAFSFSILAATYLAAGLMGLAAFWARPLDLKRLKRQRVD
jgi:uncharacterized protein (TIRG00374 family)